MRFHSSQCSSSCDDSNRKYAAPARSRCLSRDTRIRLIGGIWAQVAPNEKAPDDSGADATPPVVFGAAGDSLSGEDRTLRKPNSNYFNALPCQFPRCKTPEKQAKLRFYPNVEPTAGRRASDQVVHPVCTIRAPQLSVLAATPGTMSIRKSIRDGPLFQADLSESSLSA